MEKGKYWDVGGLAAALAGSEEAATGKISVDYLSADDGLGVIRVVLHECGDLQVIVGVADLEIQASVILCPITEIADNAIFEHRLLKANKLLPLSTFGITTMNGQEYYEIFGQLSGGSELEEIIEEVETLGRNALDAAQMIEEWKNGKRQAA